MTVTDPRRVLVRHRIADHVLTEEARERFALSEFDVLSAPVRFLAISASSTADAAAAPALGSPKLMADLCGAAAGIAGDRREPRELLDVRAVGDVVRLGPGFAVAGIDTRMMSGLHGAQRRRNRGRACR